MDPVSDTHVPTPIKGKTVSAAFIPLFQVTTFSKYLALLLFILLPFIGGYVGYTMALHQLVAGSPIPAEVIDLPLVSNSEASLPKRAVLAYECPADVLVNMARTCFKVINQETGEVLVPNITNLALEQNILNTNLSKSVVLIKILYVSRDGTTVYFYSGIPASDGCCNLHALRLDTLTFFDVSSLMGSFFASTVSPDGRYIAWVDDAGLVLKVSDLEQGTHSSTLPLELWYTLLGRCNDLAGSKRGDISFAPEGLVTYGVFDTHQQNSCTEMPIEHRSLVL